MKSKYFTDEYLNVLDDIFKLGVSRIDIHVHKNGLVITSVNGKDLNK